MKRIFLSIAGLVIAIVSFSQIRPTTTRLYRLYNKLRYEKSPGNYAPVADSAAVADTASFLPIDTAGHNFPDGKFVKWDAATQKMVFATPVKADVGLGNVDNTSDASKFATERTATATLTGKTIAAGNNTISGLTNANLSGSAGISDANIASAATWNANLSQDPTALAYQALGSNILAETVGFPLIRSNTAQNLADGTIRWVSVYLPIAHSITGINVYQIASGVYSADQNNRIGLYSYDAGTTTLTLVASSANDANVWKATANTIHPIAFSTPYSAAKAIYFVGILANSNGAFGTTPSLAAGTSPATGNQSVVDFPAGVKLYGSTTGNADLPSSINLSAITAGTLPYWVGLY